jgi:predicted transcriptional regulator
MNLYLSRLNEQQRRWYVALEAKKLGHGGIKQLSQITGMHINTIRRGKRELEQDLTTLPVERIRAVGGGRLPVEKNT